jgi:hypothetical protein
VVDIERRGEPDRADEQTRERGAADGREREADVHHRVALAQQRHGLQDRGHGAAREPAARDGKGAVNECQRKHESEQELAGGDEAERRERGGLEHVDDREHPPKRQLVDARRQQRRDQRGKELRRDEDGCGGRDRPGAVVDQHGQCDDADGVPDLVDRIGGQQASERTHAERSETPPRHLHPLYPLDRGAGEWTNVRSLRARTRPFCVKSVP